MKNIRQEHGYTMIIVVFAIVLISVIGLGLLTINANSLLTSKNEKVDQSVYYIAEGGLNVQTVKIMEFVDFAEQFTIPAVARCITDSNDANCFNPSYFNGLFLNSFVSKLKNHITTESELTYDSFKTPNSEANFVFTCKQGSTSEIPCKDFSPDPGQKLSVIIKSTGNISGKTRTIKQEIELEYMPQIKSGVLDESGEITDNSSKSIPINDSPENWWVLPIYQFDSEASIPDLKNNNWTINGFDLSENCKGNTKNKPECQRDLKLAAHDKNKLELLQNNYENYRKGCSNPEISKSHLKLGTHKFENNSVWYVNDIQESGNNNKDDKYNTIIDNINDAQVDIVICDTKKDSIFDKLDSLKATNTAKMNIYIVSDIKRETKIQKLKIHSNIFYAPNFTFNKLNSNSNHLCTNFFVDKMEKINGAGVTLTNSCSKETPPPIKTPGSYSITKPIKFYKIIHTVEI
ncbi:hypothetical protein [Solibacillus isronensis]|uniref:hypothetical protein n=1 Tax=Solibacillus isronensis TaxID=412383 RepID=UPI0009A88B2C|nr:hypothetical protein [Solibacillus isronensis]